MNSFEVALEKMNELFGRDYQFALATMNGKEPSVRFIDKYWDGKAFYIVTYKGTRKVCDISTNPKVSLACRRLHSFEGVAVDMGHPLREKNQKIRQKLTEAFRDWYFVHNSEDDENMCYLKIQPTAGFFHQDGVGYRMDFLQKTVESFPFEPSIRYTEE